MNFAYGYLAGVFTLPALFLVYALANDLHYGLGESLFDVRCRWHYRRSIAYKDLPKWWFWPTHFVKLTLNRTYHGGGSTREMSYSGGSYHRSGWCGYVYRPYS